MHEKRRDYKCEICGKSFALKHPLNRHIKTVHGKQRDYKCENCGKCDILEEKDILIDK